MNEKTCGACVHTEPAGETVVLVLWRTADSAKRDARRERRP